MSTFTPNNGYGEVGGNVAKDITELKAAVEALYTSVTTLNQELGAHTSQYVSNVDVHGVNSKFDNLLNTINIDIERLSQRITSLGESKQDAFDLTEYAKTSQLNSKANSSTVTALRETVEDNYTALHDIDESLASQITALQAAIATLSSYTTEMPLNNIETFLKLNKVVLATAKLAKHADFTDIRPTHLVYTEFNGEKYYIIGRLSNDWSDSIYKPLGTNQSKPATIYLKYVNTNGFDAVINAVCSETDASGYTGSICATVTKGASTWRELAFHLLESTQANGKRDVYLAFSCLQSLPEYVQGDNIVDDGTSATLTHSTIFAWGIDFEPLYDTPGSLLLPAEDIVCTAIIPYESEAVTVMSDVVANNIKFTSLPTYEEDTNSYLMISSQQVEALFPVGLCMNMWLNPESAVTIPEGWLRCDGREIANISEMTTAEKQRLVTNLGSTTLPVADNMIVLAYYSFARKE